MAVKIPDMIAEVIGFILNCRRIYNKVIPIVKNNEIATNAYFIDSIRTILKC